MRQATPSLILAACVALVLVGCGGGADSSPPPPPAPTNTAPIASAVAPPIVASGTVVTLTGAGSIDPDGSIASYAWTQTAGTTVTLANATSSTASFTAPTVAVATTLTFRLVVTDNRGTASPPATVSITVNPGPANVTITGSVRFTRVPFLSASPFGLNYAAAVLRPSRGVIVRALDANTQAVLAAGATDAGGGYSLSVPGNTSVTIQVVARMQRDSTQPLPRWDVRVQDGALLSVAPYTYTSAAFNSNVLSQNVDIPLGIAANGTANGVRASGPFAILDTIYTAMQTVLGVAPSADFPALVVDWGSQTVGTQFTTATAQHIALLADLTEDTDEFDQHVIGHEYGHYLEYNFSRADNIGGQHSIGDRLDMRVAFGEGWGYAFAAIALNDPLARDSFVDAGVQRAGGFNVEVNPATSPPGQFGDQIGCWCSETSVMSILWDLWDNTADANDSLALGFGPIWEVLTTTQRTTPSVTSIFSFIAALKTARPADAAAINTLVAAQNIDAANIDAFATTETHVPLVNGTPLANQLPLFSSITPGVPVILRTSDDAGRYNKAGNHRFLRFTPVTSGSITLSLSTSNTAADRDPDFYVFRSGAIVWGGVNSFTEHPETETFNVSAGTTYVIDAYDCANGCDDEQGTPGDYDLTVTIN